MRAPRMHNVPHTSRTRNINPKRSRIFVSFEGYSDPREKVLSNGPAHLPDPLISDAEDPADQLSGLYRRALELVRAEFEQQTWTMFWRTVIDGRTPAEVSAEQGVSDAAVRQAKSRVLRRLREEVGDLIN